MGIYLNPGKAAFEEAVRSKIFIDKSEVIRYLNTLAQTKQKYVCVSRPRRFGKSMTADMLCAYYDIEADSRDVFENRLVATTSTVGDELPWDIYLGQFNVIRLVMTDFFKQNKSVEESLNQICKRIIDEFTDYYPELGYDLTDLAYSMDKFTRKSGRQFVIIIDEWDAIFRISKDDHEGQTLYLDFLRDLLKDKSYIALAYMTGILPIKKYGQHSALNMFTEYSMTTPMQFAQYTGFTEAEVKELCNEYNMPYSDISSWYDGYVLSDNIPVEFRELYREGNYTSNIMHIYSPLSVVSALTNGLIRNYWNQTESYNALAEYIIMNKDGLRDAVGLLMQGERIKVDIEGYQNDMTTFRNRDDVLTLLIHLGYLGFDMETNEVFIPNKEIMDVFRTSTDDREWSTLFSMLKQSKSLLEATWSLDSDAVASLIEEAHDAADNKTYNDESALKYAIMTAYYAAREFYTEILELDSGKGYTDILYLPSPRYPEKPVLLIELKYDKDAQTAINQIRDRQYPKRLEHYKGNILLVGINYNPDAKPGQKDFKHHTCIIEKA